MSDINLDFTVSNNSINFTVEPNEITFTPTDVQLTVTTSGISSSTVGGNIHELQYNTGSNFGGTPNIKYYSSNNVITLGNLSNIKIDGGTNGYVIQTDGTGNLDWAAIAGGGNANPGGSNTQIQFNDSGLFGGNTNFTFNKLTGNVNIPNGLTVTGNITGNAYAGALSSVPYGIENITLIGAQTGTYNMDILSNAINYSTVSAGTNLTLNFRGNSTTTLNSIMGVGQSITSTYVMTSAFTGYIVSNVQIDGSAQTIKWVNGNTPTNVANSVSAFTFTLIKTASTPAYTVLGSMTRYV